jgi:hypothetical protein
MPHFYSLMGNKNKIHTRKGTVIGGRAFMENVEITVIK